MVIDNVPEIDKSVYNSSFSPGRGQNHDPRPRRAMEGFGEMFCNRPQK